MNHSDETVQRFQQKGYSVGGSESGPRDLTKCAVGDVKCDQPHHTNLYPIVSHQIVMWVCYNHARAKARPAGWRLLNPQHAQDM